MTKKWDEAAAAYLTVPKDKPPLHVDEVVEELTKFLDGEEGRSAKALLAASGKYVVLAIDDSDETESWVLTENGLGYWCGVPAVYGYRNSDLHPVSARTVVMVAARLKVPLDQFMSNLRMELDKIADRAPKSK